MAKANKTKTTSEPKRVDSAKRTPRERIAAVLRSRFALRIHTSILLLWTFSAGLLTTKGLFALGVHSSPLTYSTLRVAPIAASDCSSNVDLPMPGSPPISTTPPGTSPPPSTRSNSDTPEGMRASSRASTSDSRCSLPASAIKPKRLPPADTFSFTLSASVFHCWQPGHWPCHLGDCPPHSVHT